MKLCTKLLAAAVVFAMASPASAAIVSVAGPTSSSGTAAVQIAAPGSVLNGTVTNTGMEGFDEMQNVLLGLPLGVDGATDIAAGTRVDSHMIFLNQSIEPGGTLSHKNVVWTFSRDILGVMSGVGGADEAASTPILGAAGTIYAVFANRGFEGSDTLSILNNVLTVSMFVTQPGDWIRVVTAAIPVPAALPLFGTGLGILGFLGWRRRRKAAAV